MNYVNSMINAGQEVFDKQAHEIVDNRRKDDGKLQTYGNVKVNPNHQVTLTHSKMGIIRANCPDNFQLELSAEWMQKNGMSLTDSAASIASAATGNKAVGAMISKAAEFTGVKESRFKYLTGHVYEASAPIRASVDFEFIAEADSEIEVMTPILLLYQMTAPDEQAGILIPPGPSLARYILGRRKNLRKDWQHYYLLGRCN